MKPEFSSYCGPMDGVCEHCQARYFQKELNSTKKFTRCCSSGNVRLQAVPSPPPIVAECFTKSTPAGRMFHRKSTIFNSLLSLSSINFKPDENAGFSAVTIMGRIYSKLGPVNSNEPAYMSHYFFEGGMNVDNPKLTSTEQNLLFHLRREMMENNPLLQSIRTHQKTVG